MDDYEGDDYGDNENDFDEFDDIDEVEDEEDSDIDEDLALQLNDKEQDIGDLVVDSKGINKMLRLDSYEKAQLIGQRAVLIDKGNPSTIPIDELKRLRITGSIQIAEEELRRGILPLKLRRKMDIGPTQIISLKDIEFIYR